FPPGPQPRLLGKSGGPCPPRRRASCFLMIPVDAVAAALAVIDERDEAVRAWAHLDRARAMAEARAVGDGPLRGVTIGVKDIFDTADQPTEYGSPIYAGFQPRADAAAVALLRAAGAVVLGKTVTA